MQTREIFNERSDQYRFPAGTVHRPAACRDIGGRRLQNWEPSSTSIFTACINSTSAFAWLLLPAHGDVPAIQGEIIENTDEVIGIRIRSPEAEPFTVGIPRQGDKPAID